MSTTTDSFPYETGLPSGMSPPDTLAAQADRISARLRLIRAEIAQSVFGQDEVIERILITILAGGHGLLVGAPGLGKTLLVTTTAKALGLDSRRVQFTPDLMPSDITGSEILDEDASGHRSFRFVPGPAFCQLLMADEINRASPRTQSALLQAMQEKNVAVAGVDRPLPTPFHVLATQNPIEQEGTYPLPEAQLDRFMLQIPLDFPSADAERTMLIATTGARQNETGTIFTPDALIEAQMLVRQLPVGDAVLNAIVALVRSARPETSTRDDVRRHVVWGPGPRAAQALMLATRARALLDGRLAPSLDDVAALAHPILAHRMALSFAARAEQVSLAALIDSLLADLG